MNSSVNFKIQNNEEAHVSDFIKEFNAMCKKGTRESAAGMGDIWANGKDDKQSNKSIQRRHKVGALYVKNQKRQTAYAKLKRTSDSNSNKLQVANKQTNSSETEDDWKDKWNNRFKGVETHNSKSNLSSSRSQNKTTAVTLSSTMFNTKSSIRASPFLMPVLNMAGGNPRLPMMMNDEKQN